MPPHGLNRHAPFTVLLVDDEEIMRLTMKDMLENLGFKVIVAETGIQAIRLVQHENPEFHLVISDFRMPHMDGVTALTILREIRPGLKAILCTGTPEWDCLKGENLKEFFYLGKPFDLQGLDEAINQAMA
jgi:DNA-binding NtrC family response regulator